MSVRKRPPLCCSARHTLTYNQYVRWTLRRRCLPTGPDLWPSEVLRNSHCFSTESLASSAPTSERDPPASLRSSCSSNSATEPEAIINRLVNSLRYQAKRSPRTPRIRDTENHNVTFLYGDTRAHSSASDVFPLQQLHKVIRDIERLWAEERKRPCEELGKEDHVNHPHVGETLCWKQLRLDENCWESCVAEQTDPILGTPLLGRGTYGVVSRLRHKPTGAVFAVKSIDKRAVLESMMAAQVENEMRFQTSARHPNVLRCFGCIEDPFYVHMFMECCDKGDLYQRIKSRPTRRFEESEVFLYFMQLVNGLSYVHSQGYFHRDLKLENLLIGSDVNETLRIADFGWVGRILGSRANRNFCGTLDYLCPEMIYGSGHDWRADIWGAGILLYEMLVGTPPFHSLDAETLIKNIMVNRLHFPKVVPSDARDLIRGLLHPDPDQRMDLTAIPGCAWIKKCWVTYVASVIKKSHFGPECFYDYEKREEHETEAAVAEAQHCRKASARWHTVPVTEIASAVRAPPLNQRRTFPDAQERNVTQDTSLSLLRISSASPSFVSMVTDGQKPDLWLCSSQSESPDSALPSSGNTPHLTVASLVTQPCVMDAEETTPVVYHTGTLKDLLSPESTQPESIDYAGVLRSNKTSATWDTPCTPSLEQQETSDKINDAHEEVLESPSFPIQLSIKNCSMRQSETASTGLPSNALTPELFAVGTVTRSPSLEFRLSDEEKTRQHSSATSFSASLTSAEAEIFDSSRLRRLKTIIPAEDPRTWDVQSRVLAGIGPHALPVACTLRVSEHCGSASSGRKIARDRTALRQATTALPVVRSPTVMRPTEYPHPRARLSCQYAVYRSPSFSYADPQRGYERKEVARQLFDQRCTPIKSSHCADSRYQSCSSGPLGVCSENRYPLGHRTPVALVRGPQSPPEAHQRPSVWPATVRFDVDCSGVPFCPPAPPVSAAKQSVLRCQRPLYSVTARQGGPNRIISNVQSSARSNTVWWDTVYETITHQFTKLFTQPQPHKL